VLTTAVPTCRAGTPLAALQRDDDAAVVNGVETLGGGAVTLFSEAAQVPGSQAADDSESLYADEDAAAAAGAQGGQVLRVVVAPGAEATVVTAALRGLGAWAVYGVDAALLTPQPPAEDAGADD
jgi:hypothetical protein